MTPTDQCNHCAAPIRWLTTQTGKHMPVDAEPDPDRGNVIVLAGRAGVLNVRQATAARFRGEQLYLHHAASCPWRARWQHKPGPRSRRRAPARSHR